MQYRTGGDGGGGVAGEAEAIEGTRLQLPLQQRDGVVGAEGPRVQAGLGADGIERRAKCFHGQRREEGGLCGKQQLGRLLAGEFIECERSGGFAGEFSGAELARGEIEQRKTDTILFSPLCGRSIDRGEVVVALGTLRRIERCARGKDARDFTPDDLLGELGIFHLLADGDSIPLMKQAADVAVDCVIRHAAHGNLALAVAGGQGDFQLAGGEFRILIKKFVEIAHAEEEQSVRMLRLGSKVLPHQRRLCRIGGGSWGAGRHGNASIEHFRGRCRGQRGRWWIRLKLEGLGGMIGAYGRGGSGMKLRIAIWSALGALVVVVWRVYISVTLSNPLGRDGVGRALAYLTCPISIAHQHPQTFYFVLVVNAATYALAGVVVETTRRYYHIHSNPN
jgi:hypothetical protein